MRLHHRPNRGLAKGAKNVHSNKMRRPTLQDVAGEAGVSHMTASRVVRGMRGVRGSTAARVRAAVEKLGYRPDPAMSALAAYRSVAGGGAGDRGSVLAFMDCDATAYSGVVLSGVREEAARLGYAVESFALDPLPARQKRLARMLYHRGVRGLLFGPSDHPLKLEGWDWSEFAAVSLGALAHEPPLHAVAMDYFQGAVDGCRLLRAEGCRRIGLVLDAGLENRSGHRWIGGMLAETGSGKDCLHLYREWRERAFRGWIRKQRIDGVLTIDPRVPPLAKELGVRVAGLNGGMNVGGVPYLSLDPAHIGGEGVRLLHHLLLRQEYGLPTEPKRVALLGRYERG
jgi:LacI family transcriptional regulator